MTFEESTIETESVGETLEEYIASMHVLDKMASDEITAMMRKNNKFPEDWTEEYKEHYRSKFSTPSTSSLSMQTEAEPCIRHHLTMTRMVNGIFTH